MKIFAHEPGCVYYQGAWLPRDSWSARAPCRGRGRPAPPFSVQVSPLLQAVEAVLRALSVVLELCAAP